MKREHNWEKNDRSEGYLFLMNTVEKIIYALETFEPTVEMDESLRKKGMQPLERMMDLAEVNTYAQL